MTDNYPYLYETHLHTYPGSRCAKVGARENLEFYKEQGYDIIYIKHILSKLLWGVGFSIKGTEGAELFEGLNVISDRIFEKNKSNSFTAKPFREYVMKQGYEEMVLCGLDECGCVGATAKGAVKAGIKVCMLTDCIGRRFPEQKVNQMRTELKALGVSYI